MPWRRVKTWRGGYVREDGRGRRVYVIEQWRGGARIHRSTGCSSEPAAVRELERFELDPIGYRPTGHGEGTVRMSTDLVLEYNAHQRGKGITSEWAAEVSRCLSDWMEAIGSRDLRALDYHRDIKKMLARWTTRRPHRIKAIKGFVRWLYEEKGLLKEGQGGVGALKVPPVHPEKQKRRKVVPVEDVLAVLPKLPEVTRDFVHFLSATGWHHSEVRRFVAGGELVKPSKDDGNGVLAVLITRHKSGDLTKTPLIHPEHVAVAKRLLARGKLPTRKTTALHLREAIAAALAEQVKNNVPAERRVRKFVLGAMRHTVLTFGVEHGASVERAAEFAHHRSKKTTERFYLDLAVPKNAIPVVRLVPG